MPPKAALAGVVGNMSRIHFGYQDLLRLRFAQRPAPFVDLWLALATVQRPAEDTLFQQRRTRLRSLVNRDALPLLSLVAPTGAVPDFLAPLTNDTGAGLEAIRATPRNVVRDQLQWAFAARDHCPSWIRQLADGAPAAWETLMRALERTHSRLNAVQPITLKGFYSELNRRSDLLGAHGTEAVLESIPFSRWTDSALENDDGCHLPRTDFHLHGDGLTLLPSATWSGAPLLGTAPDGSSLLIYATLPTPSAGGGDQLGDLLGATRAAVLHLLAEPHTTSGIAHALHISLASASEHAKVLRAAGLITTERDKSAVRHQRTFLGHRLANG